MEAGSLSQSPEMHRALTVITCWRSSGWLLPLGFSHLSEVLSNGPTCHFCPLISPMALPGSSVTQLLARDMDNDPLVFGVSGEEASRFFAVEPDTGVVWLRQPLDREV